MAGGMDLGTSSGGKGKKPLDMVINLVPFIDLMAVTISFLIYASVWTQVGRLQVAPSGQSSESIPPDTSIPVAVVISETAITVTSGGARLEPLPITRNAKSRIDMTGFLATLKALKAQQPTQNAITLSPEDTVRYDDLIQFIDACVGAEFPSVTVSPASS